ncbi:hypothetical protein GCM10011412_27640 [Maribacter cobaltidurans]|nr:hypothetical protein GCM10011412_27640 [Maribacter cobaltidurans]
MKWARQYEDVNFDGRSLKTHNNWIELFNCKVLRLDGELELNQKKETVLIEIRNFQRML